ncbi:MAG: hypothetical protein VSS75_028780 [Candidatus Parabeggiatoa sp.]|nr:hypothetical protein [Candidatus Parabeggiatoa sp.]
MSRFLWIEDFEDGTEHATENVFGHLLQNTEIPATKPKLKQLLKKYGVLVEFNFLEGLRFIRTQLFEVDYVILDIDLIDIRSGLRYDEQTDLLNLLETFYGYQPDQDKSQDQASYKKAANHLKQEAGYKLYVELVMALDFPKEHILFCSNHSKEQKHIQSVFKEAKIDLPLMLSKDEKHEVQQWITKRRNNPYSILRRGIIEGCQQIQKDLSSDTILFRQFCTNKNRQNVTVQNMHDYLETLLQYLPRREPSNVQSLYKLFVRTLSHEWEDDFSPDNLKSGDIPDKSVLKRQKTFGQIIKCARNWTAHAKILDNLSERDVAFLFIVAMRAMFTLSDKTADYETLLLNLFADKLPKQELKKRIEQDSKTLLSQCSNSYSQLLQTYAQVLKNKGKLLQPPSPTQLDFSALLKTMQYWDKNNQAQFDYVTGLFQIFWQDLSPITVKSFTPTQNSQKIVFEYEYDFDLNDYGKEDMDSFLFELACSIYPSSFPK